MKRKIIITVAGVLLLFAILPLAAGYWMLNTNSGLQFAFAKLDLLKGVVRIHAAGIGGDLAHGAHIERLTIDHERIAMVIDGFDLRIRPRDLLLQTVQVESASIRKVHLELKPRLHPPSKTPLRFLPSFLRVAGNNAQISQIEVVLQNHYRIDAHALHASAIMTSRHLLISGLKIDGGFFTAAGTLDMGAADPITLSSDLSWNLVFADRPSWQGTLHASGDLNQLAVQAQQQAPIQASITGRALDLMQNWHWETKISSPSIDFAKLAPAVKITAKDIDLQVRGDHAGIEVGGTLVPVSIATGKLQVSMRGPYPGRRVQLDAVSIQAGGGMRIDASGVLNFVADGPSLDLKGHGSDFRWPVLGKSMVQSKAVAFSLSGPHLPYQFTLTGPFTLPNLPPLTVNAAGLLDHDHVTVSRATAGWLKGSIDASGAVSWVGRNEWSLSANAKDIDPGAFNVGWPGRLSGSVQVNGAGLNANADIDLNVSRLSGTLRGESAFAKGRVQRRGQNFVFDKLVARFADARLRADGEFGNPRDLTVSLDAPHLNRVFPDLKGSLSVEGRLAGPAATARLTGTIDGHGLKFSSLEAQDIHATGDIDLSDRLASRLNLKALGVEVAERKLGTVEATIDGSASQHRFTVSALQGFADIRSVLQGSYSPKGWNGTITELTVRSGNDVDVHLGTAATLTANQDAVSLGSLCLLGTNERVCVQGDWQRDGPWDLKAQGSGIPLRAFGANLPTKPEYLGVLAFDADARGRTLQDVTGRASVDLADGNLRYKLPSGREENLRLGNGHAEVSATASHIDAKLHVAATELSFLDISLGGARLANQSILQTPVNGAVHAQAHELEFIPLLVPQIDRSLGQLTANFTVAGTLAQPQLDGALALKDGEVDLYQVNLLMRAINARVDISGTSLKLEGNAQMGDGKLSIAGELAWTDRKPVGEIKLTGEKLMMVNIPELRADASPDLNFKIDGRRIDVGGTVTIPYARIKPADLTGAVLSSADEVIVGEQAVPENQRLLVYTDVKLVLGTDVSVDTYGLTGRLTGSVSATTDPSGTARGSGELKVEEGKYTAYGRQLDIQRGRLIFSGGLVSDPAVDLRAVKVFPEVTAGVNVRGRLRNPQISFFSDPSLPQSQVISVLLAGGTLESLQTTTGTQQANQARNELLAQGGAIVAQQLGSRIGIENVGLESDSLNQTSLVLGKFLNPRLYVSYGISLSESINTVKLSYTLGDHWTIKTEAGEYRSTDLVFTIER